MKYSLLFCSTISEIVAHTTSAPKFTLSRKKRNDANGVAGIGWTEDGYNKFNVLYDLVNEDRISRGATFNNELLNVLSRSTLNVQIYVNGKQFHATIWDASTHHSTVICMMARFKCSELLHYF